MSRVIALIAVLAVATPAAAYVAMPSTLLRSTGAGMRLSARKGLSSVPTMQLNPSDKSFRRATVALRAEGEEEANGPMGGGYAVMWQHYSLDRPSPELLSMSTSLRAMVIHSLPNAK